MPAALSDSQLLAGTRLDVAIIPAAERQFLAALPQKKPSLDSPCCCNQPSLQTEPPDGNNSRDSLGFCAFSSTLRHLIFGLDRPQKAAAASAPLPHKASPS
ncbi:Hypothetical predicted protein [Podarcis lilfordi]|uniref:Uncharacterized protein n=1 Tax=Podarcis lilfordi TaxID=74358 RepID=A0AA35KNV1_9SAUR|nr:Hypothetical predicted protein [Podarcis lilfordi]